MFQRQLLDRSTLEGETIVIFRAAIRSDYTRDPYERRLVHFLKWYGKDCDGFVKDGKENLSEIEQKVIKFIQEKKSLAQKRVIASSTISGYVKAIKLLLEMNDVMLNWKKIRRKMPPIRRFALDRAPTDEEIKSIVENSDIRGKALTVLFISSGIREDAIENAKVSDYEEVRDNNKQLLAGRLVVYPGESAQYTAFTTPEAWLAYQEYLKFRMKHGEEINQDSPLFRDKFDPISEIRYRKIHNTHVLKPLAMSGASIRKYYNYLFHQLGFRNGPKRRHEFSVHGFRKFFKTKAELSGMKPINVETLMGHSTGVSDSYYRPTERELLEDYTKAVPHLTSSNEKRLLQENEKLKVENSEIELLKKDNRETKSRLEQRENDITEIYKLLRKEGYIKNKKLSKPEIQISKRKKKPVNRVL